MIIYTNGRWIGEIETTFDGDTVWLSVDQMAELFQRDRSVIGKYVRTFSKRESCVAAEGQNVTLLLTEKWRCRLL